MINDLLCFIFKCQILWNKFSLAYGFAINVYIITIANRVEKVNYLTANYGLGSIFIEISHALAEWLEWNKYHNLSGLVICINWLYRCCYFTRRNIKIFKKESLFWLAFDYNYISGLMVKTF